MQNIFRSKSLLVLWVCLFTFSCTTKENIDPVSKQTIKSSSTNSPASAQYIPKEILELMHKELVAEGKEESATNLKKEYDFTTGELYKASSPNGRVADYVVAGVGTVLGGNSWQNSSGGSSIVDGHSANLGWHTKSLSSMAGPVPYSSTAPTQYVGQLGKGFQAFILPTTRYAHNGEYSPYYSFYYLSHVAGIGWQTTKTSGEISGTTGQSKSIEAVKIYLTNSEVYSS